MARISRFEVLALQGDDAQGGAAEKAILTVEYAQPDPQVTDPLLTEHMLPSSCSSPRGPLP